MTDVDQLLAEFIAEDRVGGDADPSAYLARASDEGARAELTALLDGYLARAPRRTFDRAAFSASPARGLVDDLDRTLYGSSGTWPSLLPRLRDRARMRRSDLVTQLAAALDLPGREEKVGAYYHAMEQGTLPSAGVSERVLEALGRLVGESAEVLRRAGEATSAPPVAGAETFARVASAPAAPAAAPTHSGHAARDEVDELFTSD